MSFTPPRRIGIDLDNTLADYRALFARLAVEAGVLDAATARAIDREALRAAVRASAGGEALWQQLQACAYGPQMSEATPFNGGPDFLATAFAAGTRVFMVSHRTRHAAADRSPAPVDLHQTAADWLAANRIAGADAPIAAADVFFETTRAAKLARIADLQLEVFIDDLAEVLEDKAFPAATHGLRFLPASGDDDWPALARQIYGSRNA